LAPPEPVTETAYVPPGVLLEVEMVRIAVAALVPLSVSVAELNEQVGTGVDDVFSFLTLHESVTSPVYPSAGESVIVAFDVVPAVTGAGVGVPAESV
jgi:hypothetical protein